MTQFSQFEIVFSASTRCIYSACRQTCYVASMCKFYMYAVTGYSNTKYNMKCSLRDNHDLTAQLCMLLQCANMYIVTGHSNIKYKTKYNFFQLWQFERYTLQICKSKPQINQLSIIITGLLIPNFASNVQEYFKDGRPKSTWQSQNPSTHSDIQQMPKIVFQSMRIVIILL